MLVLAGRIFLSGFVLLVPRRYAVVRLALAVVVTTILAILTLLAMPYQRVTDAYLSVAANVMLMLVFLGGLLVKLHTDIAFTTNERTAVTILGFEGVSFIVTLMLIAAIAMMAAIAAAFYFQLRAQRRLPILRTEDGTLPKLDLNGRLRWHLFLSHGSRLPDSTHAFLHQ